METVQLRDKRVVVIMPCLNEQGRIGDVVRAVRDSVRVADVVVVNDASSDNSAKEAAHAGATILSHGCTLGYGAALETGYLYAMQNGYDILVQMDGDGQHPADQLSALMAPVVNGTADLSIGSRYDGTLDTAGTTRIRKLGHKAFSTMILLVCRLRLSDPTSGFQCLNKPALALFSSGVFPCDYPDSDVIMMACMAGLRIQEVPVTMRQRKGGTSMHSGLKPLYYAIKMLLSMLIVLLNYPVWLRWHLASQQALQGQVEGDTRCS